MLDKTKGLFVRNQKNIILYTVLLLNVEGAFLSKTDTISFATNFLEIFI